MSDDGFRYERSGLDNILANLSHGRDSMDGVTTTAPEQVDAGASSELVGQAMSKLIGGGVALAGVLGDASDKLHVATGAYGDVENTNEGKLRRTEQEANMSPQQHEAETDVTREDNTLGRKQYGQIRGESGP